MNLGGAVLPAQFAKEVGPCHRGNWYMPRLVPNAATFGRCRSKEPTPQRPPLRKSLRGAIMNAFDSLKERVERLEARIGRVGYIGGMTAMEAREAAKNYVPPCPFKVGDVVVHCDDEKPSVVQNTRYVEGCGCYQIQVEAEQWWNVYDGSGWRLYVPPKPEPILEGKLREANRLITEALKEMGKI